MSQHKLCVCGRSNTFPVCDNSHNSEDWSCEVEIKWAKLGFCSSYHYQNIAHKLAASYPSSLWITNQIAAQVETLVIIVDVTDLEFAVTIRQQIQSKQCIFIMMGGKADLLLPHFPDCRIVSIDEKDIFQAYSHIKHALGSGEIETQINIVKKVPLHSAFLSHAVKDEALIIPAVEYLKRYFETDFFICANSIEPGTAWQTEIVAALKAQDYFIAFISEALVKSHFCSFEIGAAYALEKPIVLISLDGTLPPPFVQHLHMSDVKRIQQQKSWLEESDILLEVMLKILQRSIS